MNINFKLIKGQNIFRLTGKFVAWKSFENIASFATPVIVFFDSLIGLGWAGGVDLLILRWRKLSLWVEFRTSRSSRSSCGSIKSWRFNSNSLAPASKCSRKCISRGLREEHCWIQNHIIQTVVDNIMILQKSEKYTSNMKKINYITAIAIIFLYRNSCENPFISSSCKQISESD